MTAVQSDTTSRSRALRGMKMVDAAQDHLLVSKTFPYAFYFIPKCACTTIKNLLWSAEIVCGAKVLKAYDRSLIHHLQRDPRSPWISQRGAIAAELTRSQQERVWFVVARNPYARLFSAYQWLLVDANPETRRQNLAKLSWAQDAIPSFATFVELVSLQLEQDMDHHWAPVCSFVPMNDIDFDVVGNVETFSEDMPRIMDRIFSRSGLFDEKLRMFRSTAPEWSSIAESMSPATIGTIQKVFAADFETFHYSTDPRVLEPLRRSSGRQRFPSKLSADIRSGGKAYPSRKMSGPDASTVADVAQRFAGVDVGHLRGLVLRNADLPAWWARNNCQLWSAAGAPLPEVLPHPGLRPPEEALVVLGGNAHPASLMIWGKGSTIVTGEESDLPGANLFCGDGAGIFLGPKLLSAGFASIDARNGGTVVVEGDGLWFHNVRISNDGLHAIRDRASKRINAYGSDVRISRRVWLGDGVFVEPGASIGEGTVIANRARVAGVLPANAWCSGDPAVVHHSDIRWGHENEP